MLDSLEGETWTWRAAKLIALTIGMVVAAILLWQLVHVLLLLFGAVLIAVLLRAVAWPIERFTPVPERAAVVLAGLLIAAALGGFFWLLGAQIQSQVALLLESLPELVGTAEDRLGVDGLDDWLEEQRLAILEDGGELAVNVASYSTWLVGIAADALIALAAGIYLALKPRSYVEGVVSLVPEPRHEATRETLQTTGRALRLWLLGQLGAMVLVGTLTTIGLWLLGIPSALALGVIAGLFEFVPFIGPLASAVPAVIVGLAEGPTSALWVVGLYLLIQQIEGILITPLVQQYTVDLAPVVTIFAIIAFGTLFGPLGLLLATPMAVVCLVLVKKLWVRDVLEEEVEVPGEKT